MNVENYYKKFYSGLQIHQEATLEKPTGSTHEASTKLCATTASGVWFNVAYFFGPKVDTHGQQNSNQLDTVGFYIPASPIVFLGQQHARESHPPELRLSWKS